MTLKHVMIGGLFATALTIGTANTASAQVFFGPGFGPTYQQSTFVTPNGGFVNRTSTYDPFIGQSTYNNTYVNPYTGMSSQRQFVSGPGYSYGTNYGYSNGYGNGYGYIPQQPLPVGLSPGFATSSYYNATPAYTPVYGYRSNYINPYVYRPGFNFNFNFGR